MKRKHIPTESFDFLSTIIVWTDKYPYELENVKGSLEELQIQCTKNTFPLFIIISNKLPHAKSSSIPLLSNLFSFLFEIYLEFCMRTEFHSDQS